MRLHQLLVPRLLLTPDQPNGNLLQHQIGYSAVLQYFPRSRYTQVETVCPAPATRPSSICLSVTEHAVTHRSGRSSSTAGRLQIK